MSKEFINDFHYPKKSVFGSALNFILNNILFIKINRLVFYLFTKAKLRSEIKNVVYLNWLIPFQKIQHLVPKHVKIKSYQGQVLFTVLTYQHGHFRPAAFGKLKRCFASPLQSNWRLYVENNEDFGIAQPAVFFIKVLMNNLLYTVGSRVFSSILQTHLPASFEHHVGLQEGITKIVPGLSNSPDLRCTIKLTSEWNIPEHIASKFADTGDLMNTICNQDFAISKQPDQNKYAVAHMKLQFNQEDLQLAEVINFKSEWLKEIVSDSPCFAFVIKKLSFTTMGERIIKKETETERRNRT